MIKGIPEGRMLLCIGAVLKLGIFQYLQVSRNKNKIMNFTLQSSSDGLKFKRITIQL